MKNQLKLFLAIALILTGIFSFAQNKFNNKKLALLNDIFYNTAKGNIDSYMKGKGFEKGSVEKENDDNIKEIYTFSAEFDMIEVYYTKGDKVYGVNCLYAGTPNSIVIEAELLEKGYKDKIEKEEWNGEIVSKNVWSKSGSKLNFVTTTDETNQVGTVAFGNYYAGNDTSVENSEPVKPKGETSGIKSANEFAIQMNKYTKKAVKGFGSGYVFQKIGKIDSDVPSIMFFAKDNELYIRTYEPDKAYCTSGFREFKAESTGQSGGMPNSFYITFTHQTECEEKKLKGIFCILPWTDDAFRNDIYNWWRNNLKLNQK